ncbi:antibiotic biosynthesis monooxygenase family protein [Actinoplanes sp. NPDC049548]|uniref:antibiotic biosynthesis monooxygenase family protein n=1 Tax=Actinoplanes sp. NPDC049548 TaxID=3155152 RepID=UPI003419AE5A
MLTMVNQIKVTGDPEAFRKALAALSTYMKAQPGFLSHRLYRSTRNPNSYFETAEWTDGVTHQQALTTDTFRELVGELLKHATADPDFVDLVESDEAVAAA